MSPRQGPAHSPDPAPTPDLLVLPIDGMPPETRAFAQFLKRATWDHYRSLAVSDDEARAMQRLAERLRLALAEQGYAPR